MMIDQQDKAPRFLVKLLNILRSKEYAKIVGWVAEEKGIKIHNQKRFQQEILPRYYRHNKMSSFIRQLNMYDFHKVYLDNQNCVFHHEVFNPRKKDSINFIRRKVYVEQEAAYEKENQNVSVKKNECVKGKKIQPEHKKQEVFLQKKSSFKLLLKNSLGSFKKNPSSREHEVSTEQVLDQIIGQIAPLRLSEQSIREKIDELRKHSKFRRFLKRGSFLCKIYAKLGIEMNRDEDKLSELSIEDQLLYKTNYKEVSLTSLKMFESRPAYLRDTIGMFLN